MNYLLIVKKNIIILFFAFIINIFIHPISLLAFEKLPFNSFSITSDKGKYQEPDDSEITVPFEKGLYAERFTVMWASSIHRGSKRKVKKEEHPTSPVIGVDTSSFLTLDVITERVSHKKIVYVGETHNLYEHHVVQLDVIKSLHKRGIKLAIGMEMFQRKQQKALDDYINNLVDEKTFLKTSRYFKYWNFDYNFYRGIIEYAKENKIPVIALNIDNAIVKKVSGTGLSSLSEDEKKKIPESIDLTDLQYKKRLKEIFQNHKGSESLNFEFFYEAQLLWDETMAKSVHHFLTKHPDYSMVVLAGAGHIAYGSGIPKRAFRRNALPYATIINSSGDKIDKNIADFVIFPPPMDAPLSPKLMVMIEEKEDKVVIVDFPPESISKKAGLKEGDIIYSLDGEEINNIEDIRIFLLFKSKGDKVAVKVLRKGQGPDKEELNFSVVL